MTVATFFSGVIVYQFVPQEGENSAVMNLIHKYQSRAEHWAELNALHTKASEQAGFDRNLFENASTKHRYVNVAFPEYVHFISISRLADWGWKVGLLILQIGPSSHTRQETSRPDR